jgi:hypothetical protein
MEHGEAQYSPKSLDLYKETSAMALIMKLINYVTTNDITIPESLWIVRFIGVDDGPTSLFRQEWHGYKSIEDLEAKRHIVGVKEYAPQGEAANVRTNYPGLVELLEPPLYAAALATKEYVDPDNPGTLEAPGPLISFFEHATVYVPPA